MALNQPFSNNTSPIIQVSYWSLGGHGCSWWSWRWCQDVYNIPRKHSWKFHQDPTSGTLSRLHLSSKSLPGVLEDLDVLYGAGDGFRVLIIFIRSLTESFIKIQHKDAYQDSPYHQSLFLESWRKGMFLMKQEMVSGYPKYPKEALLKVTSRSNTGNLVKTTPIIIVSFWSLGGQGCPW